MHNRQLVWITREGKHIKLEDMTSSHLNNLYFYLKNNKNKILLSRKEYKDYMFNIKQELRLRKLNRIEMSQDEDKLF